MAYQLRQSEDVSDTAGRIEGTLSFLADRAIITEYRVIEQ
jgi:hypothetical protein